MELQKYKGFYVDYRLKQFRSAVAYHEEIEFIDFKSERGDEMLVEMLNKKLIPADKMNCLI